MIFAIGEKPAKQFIKYVMLEWAVDKLKAMCCAMVAPDDVVFKVVQLHVLFPFHPFASFAFHTDKASMRNSQVKDLGATVIINLGPDESAMQIAGAPPTTYKFPGDMKMFDAIRAWHCSRWSTERTVKIALFVSITRVADGTNMDLTGNDLQEAGGGAWPSSRTQALRPARPLLFPFPFRMRKRAASLQSCRRPPRSTRRARWRRCAWRIQRRRAGLGQR